MRYLYKRGDVKNERVMHIERTSAIGEHTMRPLCDTRIQFDTTINAPFALGRPVCKKCRRVLAKLETVGA